jgi:chorismate-pyruvate lyase
MVVVDDPSGLGLETALARTGGSVTSFLEQLVGEHIDARPRLHEMIEAHPLNELRVEGGKPLLHRAATLEGRISGCTYVYAESVIVTNRLPSRFSQRLESSSDPIGRILDEEGIAVTREALAEPDTFVVARSWNADVALDDYLFARTYRIDAKHIPAMVITEWFLTALVSFLPLP